MWNSRKMNKSLVLVVLFLAACWTNGYGANVTDPTAKPDVITTEPAPTTVVPSTEASTSSSTTTTTTSTTSSTTTTTSTTLATTTTTTAAPITTPAPPPKPVPAPTIGKWNTSCIMIQMAAQLNLTYETTDNKTMTALYNMPANATIGDSQCLNETESFSLEWGPEKSIYSFHIRFNKNDTKNEFELAALVFHIPIEGDNFPNAKANQTVQLIFNGKLFATPIHMSYHCTREQHLNLTETLNENAEPNGWVSLTNVQFEAFRPANKTSFSTAKDCDAMDTPDVVPIAVGIALATLIVIVLIAYLIARRRSTARGYTSF